MIDVVSGWTAAFKQYRCERLLSSGHAFNTFSADTVLADTGAALRSGDYLATE